MAKLIYVRSALPPGPDGGARWALWDVHPDHPADPEHPQRQHEIKVVGDAVVQVGETPRVLKAIAEGTLERVDGPDAKPRTPAPEAAPEPEPENRSGRR